MLTSTFRHFTGVGAKTERELWRSGIWSWQEFEARRTVQLSMFEVGPYGAEVREVLTSKEALEKEDANYFALSLPRHEHYRIAHSFPLKTLFLDIETTGLSRYYDQITIVGWSMGRSYNTYIKGDDPEPLRRALVQAKAIVTFNGSLFDLPFLRTEFPELNIPVAHVDLRFLARRVGFRGGQKEIEEAVGLQRPGILSTLRGETAPLLWHRYRRGDVDALKLLVSYNYADIEGMKFILDVVTDRLLEMDHLPMRLRPPHRFSGDSLLDIATFISSSGRVREYQGSSAPLITLDELNVPRHCVVGIDLTGSEERPSGWCVLQNGRATTLKIGSDADLIRATMDAKPTLVSIDSPLSLPRGRVSVDDDDPGRASCGITRECERILKRRGVNVYPSLIKSMQALTARGIRLARHFRSIGIAVIESYPGAAQDIMNIPRKGADVRFLKDGLIEFGVSGEFTNQSVSHDELDAITSAVVGLFFISGRFEALGNEDEEYLIIPDIKQKKNPWGARIVIGLSGPISAGKTTAGEYLQRLGFAYGRYSQVLQDLLRDRGIPVTRESLQRIGEEIHLGLGQRWLGAELVKRMPSDGNLVIDGLRHPEDHAFLSEKFGPYFLHIHIDAPDEVRRQRYVSEGSAAEFTGADAHPIEANIPKLASLAHITVSNSGTLGNFLSTIERIINDYSSEEGRIICH